MLPVSTFNDIQGAFDQVINLIGLPATFTQVKPPNSTASFNVGFRTAKSDESEIINTYGVGTVIITGSAGDFPVPPQKFDKITIGAENYTVHTALPVHLGNVLIGWKMYAKV